LVEFRRVREGSSGPKLLAGEKRKRYNKKKGVGSGAPRGEDVPGLEE